jgi:hypothetical protein
MVAKQPGCATDHPQPSSAESKNASNYTSTHTSHHRVVGYDVRERFYLYKTMKPLNAELIPICHLLALLRDHHILCISRLWVNISDSKQTSHQFGNKSFEIHYAATDIAIYKCLLRIGLKNIITSFCSYVQNIV